MTTKKCKRCKCKIDVDKYDLGSNHLNKTALENNLCQECATYILDEPWDEVMRDRDLRKESEQENERRKQTNIG